MMYAWKFFISPNRGWIPDAENPDYQWKGCLAVAIAATEEDAKALLTRYANEMGFDSRWLATASVSRLPVDTNAVLGWAVL